MTTLIPQWEAVPADLALEGRDIHVWRADLAAAEPECLDACRAVLSADEVLRAERFHLELHRRRFTLCRGLLRTLLGRYLAVPPHRIAITCGEHGKPAVAGPAPADGLCFNLAHSRDLVLLAFAWNRPVGVDIEYLRDMPRAEDLARRFFSPDEHAGILRLPPGRRREGFLRCWTAKEAFLKATGAGFSFPMDRFSVCPFPGEPARLIRVAGDPQAPRSWTLTAFVPARGYRGALAAAGSGGRCRWYEAPWRG